MRTKQAMTCLFSHMGTLRDEDWRKPAGQRSARSEEAIHYRAVHNETDRAELLAIQPGDPAFLDHSEDGELLRYPGTVPEFDRALRPDRRIDVPDRAVVGGNGW